MKRTLRKLALLSMATVLVFTGCKKYQDGENSATSDISGAIAGRDYVDLGLPSGTKLATCNVGASQPHENGNYWISTPYSIEGVGEKYDFYAYYLSLM